MVGAVQEIRNPLAVIPPPKPARHFTLGEYLEFEAKSQSKHEYHNGNIVKMPYSKGPHNIISANMIGIFKAELKAKKKQLMVLSSDQKIYFPKLNVGVYADALVVCENAEYFDKFELLLTNPILVVEVLSKSTKAYDRDGKFSKYKTLPSFREYILVEQNFVHVESWFREEPGLWRETIANKMGEKLNLKSLGIQISVADIYEFVKFKK